MTPIDVVVQRSSISSPEAFSELEEELSRRRDELEQEWAEKRREVEKADAVPQEQFAEFRAQREEFLDTASRPRSPADLSPAVRSPREPGSPDDIEFVEAGRAELEQR